MCLPREPTHFMTKLAKNGVVNVKVICKFSFFFCFLGTLNQVKFTHFISLLASQKTLVQRLYDPWEAFDYVEE